MSDSQFPHNDYDALLRVAKQRRSVRKFEKELSELLGYPEHLKAYGTIPIGYPEKDVAFRYRRPLEQLVHWDRFEPTQYRPQTLIDFYNDELRPFTMYRGEENASDWPDVDEKLGKWKEAFTGSVTNPSGKFDD